MISIIRYLREHSVNFVRRLRSDELIENDCENIPLSIIRTNGEAITLRPSEFTICCNNTSSILQIFDYPCIKEEFKHHDRILLLNIQIDGPFDKLIPKKIEALSNKCTDKSILIFIASKNEENFAIYWKLNSTPNLLSFVDHKNSQIKNKRMLYEFLYDFIAVSMNDGNLGLKNSATLTNEHHQVQLCNFSDNREAGLLLIAAECGRNEVIEDLLNEGVEAEMSYNEIVENEVIEKKSSAVDVAWKNGQNSNVLLSFLRANLKFPQQFDIAQCSDKVKKFLAIAQELHEAIKSKDETKIIRIVTENPNQRHFYNSTNMSAAKQALTHKCIDIYELLIKHKVYPGYHESIAELSNLSGMDCERVKEIHFKHSVDMPGRHLHSLTINSTVSHDDPSAVQRHHYIRYAFEYLNAIPFIQIILMVVAASKIFNIIFDFNRKTIQFLDPTDKSNSKGLYYPVGRIYVAAYELVQKMTERETFGTLAHELCHYAMKLLYGNMSKPYLKKDKARREEFERISKICHENRHKEDLIDLAYHYSHRLQHAELIVRVPHLMALYNEQPEKLRQVRDDFIELFIFYETKVVPDMKNAIPLIDPENRIENKNLKIFGYKISLVLLGILCFIIIIVGGWTMYLIFKPHVYSQLSNDEQNKVCGALVSYKNVLVRLEDLFPNNAGVCERLTSVHISKILDGEILNFNDPYLYYLDELIIFNWTNMAENLKKKALDLDLNFQGEDVKLIEISRKYPESLNSLTSQQIKDTLNGTKIIIGKTVELEMDFYFQRKFLPEDAKFIDFEYNYGHDYAYEGFTIEEYKKNRTSNKTYQEFYDEFIEQDLDTRSVIFDKIKEHSYFKAQFYNLSHDHFLFLHKNSSTLIEIAENEKILILSSEAGGGKTATFEHLTLEIKQMYPTMWVSYIDLKNYIQLYINHTKLNKKSENVDELLQKIFNLSSTNEFELKIFENSFDSGNVVLVWNGFDEISPDFNKFILDSINYIRENTSNVQYVSTRPSYSEQLSKSFKSDPWIFVPIEERDMEDFLREFFISQNVDSKKINEDIKKVKEIIKRLHFERLNHAYQFNTPLMLKLVAETRNDEKLKEPSNLYGIYDFFITKKTEIWLDKNTPDRAQSVRFIGDVEKFYQKCALLNSLNGLGGSIIGIKMRKLEIMQMKIPSKMTYTEISSIGFLNIVSKNKFEFVHRTFSDFFVAQYFIDNIYNSENFINDDEALLRLEVFFRFAKGYGFNQEIMGKFMSTYLDSDSRNSSFNEIFSQLLRTKFKNFFFRILDTINPDVFEFLFKFFQKDHKILTDLLHIDEDETFYTAVYNPNYFGQSVDPEKIKNVSQKYLTDEEFQKFLNGKNQKGKILFGIKFYSLLGFSKVNELYDKKFNQSSFGKFLDEVNGTLTFDERKALFVSILSPKIYMFYNAMFDSSDYGIILSMCKNLFSSDELQDVLGDAFIQYFEIYPSDKPENINYLLNLVMTTLDSMNTSQIYEMIITKNILHESLCDSNSAKIIWDLLTDNMTAEEQRQILLSDDFDDKNFYFYLDVIEPKKIFSKGIYPYYYYDFTPFKMFHRSLTAIGSYKVYKITVKIYEERFNNNEFRDIIMSSNDFIYYAVTMASEEPFKEFTMLLEKLFLGNKKSLKDILNRKIEPTNLSVFELFEQIRGLAISQQRWFNNLKTLSELIDRIEN